MPPAKRHRIKIKGIPGGQPSGMTLVSANMPAFESYGLEASLIAPICSECTEHYANGANRLIRDPRTHLVIGPVMYLFWKSGGDDESSILSLLREPQPDEVKELLRAAWTSRAAAVQLDPTPYYATALTASGSRVAVREWLETTVGEVRQSLARYFSLQRIVRTDGNEPRPIGLFALAASLVAPKADIPPNIPDALLRLALSGAPLPHALLAAALRRVRQHRRDELAVTHPRAAVIKMTLLGGPQKEGAMDELDTTLHHPAYLCGRVFAIVEAIQRAALGDVNATVADRYFGAASTSPAYVLGKLVSDARKAHLGKLRRRRPGAYYALDQRLADAMEGLEAFPVTLTLEDQGRFVLGYYHQRAADRKAARMRRELRALAPDAAVVEDAEQTTEPEEGTQ
jgi:CRISPR-associated protein Csd1